MKSRYEALAELQALKDRHCPDDQAVLYQYLTEAIEQVDQEPCPCIIYDEEGNEVLDEYLEPAYKEFGIDEMTPHQLLVYKNALAHVEESLPQAKKGAKK